MKIPTPQKQVDTDTIHWCPFCSGEGRTAEGCSHAGARTINRIPDGTLLAEKYEVITLIGVGGMGVVYKCKNEYLNKLVAIKTMAQKTFTDQQFVRFQREARAAGKFSHPNLVSILDFGITGDGEPFMVMDFIEGKTLDQFLAEDNVSLLEVLDLFIQCCEGLAYAHSQGVLHRDLKPGNIMIVEEGDQLVAKVLDFGIAKLADDAQHGMTLTLKGAVFGTAPYMSPEQSRGENIDQLSDIYSLGCVLFEALTGRRPFEGTSSLETIRMHQEEISPALASVAPQKSYPQTLENLIASTLSKHPPDRPKSMNEFKTRLEEIVGEIVFELEATLPEAPIDSSQSSNSFVQPSWFSVRNICAVTIGLSTIIITFLASRDFIKPGQQPKVSDTTYSALSMVGELEGIADPESMASKKSLRVLNLNDVYCSKNGSVEIAFKRHVTSDKLQKMREWNIKFLNNTSCDITDDGLYEISQWDQLDKLYIKDCQKITGRGIKYLGNLKRISTIDLNSVRNLHKDSLKPILKLPTLRNLNLDGNSLQNDTIALIAASPAAQRLEFLSLANTEVTNDGLVYLEELSNLRTIDLSGDRISDVGVNYLCKCKKLENIFLKRTQITNKTLEMLSQSSLPLVQFEFAGTRVDTHSLLPQDKMKLLRKFKFVDHKMIRCD